MPPFSHRAPGVVGAALTRTAGWSSSATAYISTPRGPGGVPALWGQAGGAHPTPCGPPACPTATIPWAASRQVKGKYATLADGTLAGSVTDLMSCMRLPSPSAFRWRMRCGRGGESGRAIGIYSRVGSIESGKLANLAVLDKIWSSRLCSAGQVGGSCKAAQPVIQAAPPLLHSIGRGEP